MDLYIVLIRAVLFYILIFATIRFMGKREIGELGTIDIIVLLMIADIGVLAIENIKDPWYFYVLAILILALIQIVIAKLSLKFVWIRKITDGKESVIIYDGRLMLKEMKKQKYSMDDLLVQARQKNIRSLSEIDYAILENNGELSVFKKDDKENHLCPLPVIVSGKIITANLKYYSISENEILMMVEKNNTTVKNVYYATVDKGELFIMNGENS